MRLFWGAVFIAAAMAQSPAFARVEIKVLGDSVIRNEKGEPILVSQENGRTIGSRQAALLHGPKPTLLGRETLPLIIFLHGYSHPISLLGNTYPVGKATDRFYLKFSQILDQRRFLLLLPEGIQNLKGKQYWNATDFCCDGADQTEKTGVNDVAYIKSLITEVKATRFEALHGYKAGKVFVMGHSNGGFMANRLICSTQDLLSGIVSLAGANYKDTSFCKPLGKYPVLQIHAVDDSTVKYAENPFHSSALETVAFWGESNGCHLSQSETRSDLVSDSYLPGLDATMSAFEGCGANPVELWTLDPSTSRGLFHRPHKPGFKSGFNSRILDWFLRFN